MKGILSLFSAILISGLVLHDEAKAGEKEIIQLTNEEISEFKKFGFYEEQLLEGLSVDLYEELNRAEVEAYEKVIYKITESDNGYIEYDMIDEKTYEDSLLENQFGVMNASEDSGWIVLELTVANLGGGERRVTNSFEFQGDSPFSTYRDAVGISHDFNSQNRPSGTSFWYQTNIEGSGNYVFPENTNEGIGIAFDLFDHVPIQNHRGSLSVVVVDSGGANRATAYGHFIHSNTPTWFDNISIGVGSFSVSALANQSDAIAPSVSWEW